MILSHWKWNTYKSYPKCLIFPHMYTYFGSTKKKFGWTKLTRLARLSIIIWNMVAGRLQEKSMMYGLWMLLNFFFTSIFMSDLLLHLFKTFLLNFLTTQFLQIHPSIKAKNFLPSIPFCEVWRKKSYSN